MDNKKDWLDISEIKKPAMLITLIIGVLGILLTSEKSKGVIDFFWSFGLMGIPLGVIIFIISVILLYIVIQLLFRMSEIFLDTIKIFFKLPNRIDKLEKEIEKIRHPDKLQSEEIKAYSKEFTKNELIVLRKLVHWEHETFRQHFIFRQNKISILSDEIGLSIEETMNAVNLLLDKSAVGITHPLSPESIVKINGNFAIINKELFLSLND